MDILHTVNHLHLSTPDQTADVRKGKDMCSEAELEMLVRLADLVIR